MAFIDDSRIRRASQLTALSKAEPDDYFVVENNSELKGFKAGKVKTMLDANIIVTVGSGGDFATINAALTYLSRYYPLYKSRGYTAGVNLLADFVMKEQVFIEGLDLGWITITSVSAEVTIDRSKLTTLGVNNDYPAFSGNYCIMPNISVLFNMSNDGTATNRNGISLLNSRCNINPDKGVKNAGEKGLLATRFSIVNARKSNFSGALGNCCHISTGSLLNLNEANVSNSGAIAIYAGRGAKVIAYDSIDVSNYTIYSVKVEYGSFVIVSQSMSDAGFSQTKNTFNGHGAIMSA